MSGPNQEEHVFLGVFDEGKEERQKEISDPVAFSLLALFGKN